MLFHYTIESRKGVCQDYATLLRGVGESLGPGSARFWNEKGESDCSSEYHIRITEVIQKGYSRYNSPKIKEAIQKEIKRIWNGIPLNNV